MNQKSAGRERARLGSELTAYHRAARRPRTTVGYELS